MSECNKLIRFLRAQISTNFKHVHRYTLHPVYPCIKSCQCLLDRYSDYNSVNNNSNNINILVVKNVTWSGHAVRIEETRNVQNFGA